MFNSGIFDLAIGIIFIFLLVSLVCTQVGDKVSAWLRWRSKNLEAGIRKFIMDSDETLFDDFYNNAVIKSLKPVDTVVTRCLERTPFKGLVHPNQTPIRISAKTFATVMFNAVIPDASGATTIDDLPRASPN